MDLQLIQIIDDFREKCQKNEISLESKFLMNGFSASSIFASRFAALNSKRLKAVATGGSTFILPIDRQGCERLIYPVGIADLWQITGKSFNFEEFIKVPKFYYVGALDDHIPGGYDRETREILMRLFGSSLNLMDIFENARRVYNEIDLSANFVIYEGIEHSSRPMERDVLDFFRSNIL